MTDVFVCSCAADDIRKGLRDAVYARWVLEPDTNVMLLTPKIVGCTNPQFQGMRRPWIEQRAQSDIYVMAEDDCMPWGTKFVEKGVDVLRRHLEFAVLSPLLLPYPEVPSMIEWPECYEGITSGGINFTRKGILKDMIVPTDSVFDEGGQAGFLKRAGWRTGWMKDVKQLHLGATLSTIWPDDYATGLTKVNEP